MDLKKSPTDWWLHTDIRPIYFMSVKQMIVCCVFSPHVFVFEVLFIYSIVPCVCSLERDKWVWSYIFRIYVGSIGWLQFGLCVRVNLGGITIPPKPYPNPPFFYIYLWLERERERARSYAESFILSIDPIDIHKYIKKTWNHPDWTAGNWMWADKQSRQNQPFFFPFLVV